MECLHSFLISGAIIAQETEEISEKQVQKIRRIHEKTARKLSFHAFCVLLYLFSYYYPIKRFKKICEADLRQTRRRTQTGLTPGKDDNDVWHKSGHKDIK